MPQNIAIRLNVEGGAALKRELEEAGRTGQQAFTTVSTAADAAGAATDRLRQKTNEAAVAAAAARDAQAAAAARAPAAPPAAPPPPPVAPPAPSAPSARVIESVRRDIDEEYRRGQQFARAESAIGAGAASGRYDATERDRLLNLAREKYRVGNDNNRLRADQITNLTYQGGDIVSQLGSGTSLSTIALQQGPQIAGVFSGGQGSIRGAITQASEAVTGFASRIGLVGGAIGVVTAVVGTGIVALSSYREGQRAVEQSLNGIGRASGATVGQINAVAQASAASAGVSVSSAREMASEFASTGKIGAAMYADLIGTTRDFALTTGQELPDATRALATAFADPAKGAETLNAQLGFLDATTLESIQRLQQQGDRLGAQRVLFDAYSTSVVKANEKLGFFSRQWQDFKTTTSNEVDGIGRFIDRGLGGGAAEERLATLQAQLKRNEDARGSLGGLLNPLFDYDAGVIREQITKVQAEIDKAAKEGSTRSLAQRSQEIGNITKSLNPAQQLIEQIEDRAKNFAKFLNVEGGIDKDGSIRRTMDALVAQGKVLREDLIAGGTQFAQGLRDAQANLRLVGFSESGRNIAGIALAAHGRIRHRWRTGSGAAAAPRWRFPSRTG